MLDAERGKENQCEATIENLVVGMNVGEGKRCEAEEVFINFWQSDFPSWAGNHTSELFD